MELGQVVLERVSSPHSQPATFRGLKDQVLRWDSTRGTREMAGKSSAFCFSFLFCTFFIKILVL